MSSPVIPDRPERFTTNMNLRVPADAEDADLVTVLGDMLDDVDDAVTEQVALAAEHALTAQLAAVAAMTTAQRDALPADQKPIGRIIYNTTIGQHEGVANGGGWVPVAPPTKVDVFTTSGVWTKPPFAVSVEVFVFSGGGGGAGTGGSSGGGGGGARVVAKLCAAALGGTVAVTVGAGGAGSAGAATAGSASSFGTSLGALGAGASGAAGQAAPGIDDATTSGGTSGAGNTSGQPSLFAGGGGSSSVFGTGGASGLLAGGASGQPGGSRSGSGLAGSGAGGTSNASGLPGGIPSGGGGVASTTGGAGGRGEVIVITHF